ncbi:MAG: CTP synthase [Pseudomonadota bacterium]|nr:CTP synthase [Pseudomonadota bacterium]
MNNLVFHDSLTMHYIFITGGVVSSLGKGIISGSLGALLEASGFKVTCMKLDPYINVDPGTMSPQEHGEVYVTEDGAETDLDLGHYERFLKNNLRKEHSITSGQVYADVIERERRGDYLGATVQVIPHITDQIQNKIEAVGENTDIVLVEVGGTVGDIESLPFLEAIRQMRMRVGHKNVVYIHLTLLPYIKTAGEMKTKPTQHSVKEMRSIGIQPDILICRAERDLMEQEREKIGLFTNVPTRAVISVADVDSIYKIPLVLAKQNVDKQVRDHFQLPAQDKPVDLTAWEALIAKEREMTPGPRIAIVGKYINSKDAYKSLIEAVKHASITLGKETHIEIIDAEKISDKTVDSIFANFHGIIVAGGFGERGVEGKIQAIRWAREQNRPFFGICLGMQLAVVEYSRNVLKLPDANSTEFDINTQNPVICLIDELQNRSDNEPVHMGGTMRLGTGKDHLSPGSKIHAVYQASCIAERHRHRYEVNPDYIEPLEAKGFMVSGRSDCHGYVDVIELKEHPWFIGCQFHPEFNSKPLVPHPLFIGFLQEAYKTKTSQSMEAT